MECRKRASDVGAWPCDGETHQVLASYMGELEASSEVQPELAVNFMDMRGADLAGIELSGAEFFGTNLEGVGLSRACLGKADFRGAEMSGADFSGCWMMKAEAYECTARRASFVEAQLVGTSFLFADLQGADFRGSWLFNVRFGRADLRGADFRDAHFGPDHNRTSMDRARLEGAAFENASGVITGAAYVDDGEPLGGSALESWFRHHGSPNIRVVER